MVNVENETIINQINENIIIKIAREKGIVKQQE